MAALLTLTVFLGAALTFLVEPMIGKMLLPLLGGTPAVWNGCMLFFQAALLAGYAYAHLLGRRLALRSQVLVHAAVLAVPLAALPLAARPLPAPTGSGSPIPWLLRTLVLTVGPAFVVLAATGPLVQRWLAATDHPAAGDPYFLFAASNAGSLLGLAAYPILVEPSLPLRTDGASLFPPRLLPLSQSTLFTAGYLAFAALAMASGLAASRRARAEIPARELDRSLAPAPSLVSRLRWLALAFVPASALLGATQYLTADVAAFPLLWVVPLATYLATFILAFSSRLRLPAKLSGVLLAVLVTAVAASLLGRARSHGLLLLPLHLATLFAVGMTCHARLAEARPRARDLTGYYLVIALGGALGGVFNTLVAPLLFESFTEYPIVLVLACCLRPASRDEGASRGSRWRSRALDVAVPALLAGVLAAMGRFVTPPATAGSWGETAFFVVGPALLVLATAGWRTRFALSVAVLMAWGWIPAMDPPTAIRRERSFFGSHRVEAFVAAPVRTRDERGRETIRAPLRHLLVHGATRHGVQNMDEDLRRVPSTYYHPTGPLGEIFALALPPGSGGRVGVVGLGAGSIAAYGEPGRRITFFEIDPAVIRIARDPSLFTYLADSRSEIAIEAGDGRRSLDREADGSFDLIVLDAFSSDAIPVHLLTREAVAGYLRKLAPDGVLAIHLTNEYARLEPVVGTVASSLGLASLLEVDRVRDAREEFEGKEGSVWAALARDPARLAPLRERGADTGWTQLPVDPRFLWTDDFSNVLGVVRIR